MLTENSPDSELLLFLNKFFLKYYHRQHKKDYNQYMGELIYTAYLAKQKFDSSRGVKFFTYLCSCLIKNLAKLNKREKKWYEKHISSTYENVKAPDYSPDVILQYRETIDCIKNSKIPEKTKEIIIYFLTKPSENLSEIGEKFGVSKQWISNVLNNSKKYFLKYNVNIEEKIINNIKA